MGFADFFLHLLNTYGYLGVFLASLLSSASVIFPVPGFLVIYTASVTLNPLLVGLIAGFGSALGELIGYIFGIGGRKAIKKKYSKWLKRAENWSEKRGMFLIILLFAATPLPDDVIGILCGTIKYDVKKFFLACLIGKIILSLLLAYAGYYSITWILEVFGLGA